MKNKVAPPFKQAEFDIIYGSGISWEGTVLDAALERKVVQKSGSYFSFEDERLGQGRQNATAFLREHPDVTQGILAGDPGAGRPEQVVSARLLPTTTPRRTRRREGRRRGGRGADRAAELRPCRVTASAGGKVAVELDGEPWRTLPATRRPRAAAPGRARAAAARELGASSGGAGGWTRPEGGGAREQSAAELERRLERRGVAPAARRRPSRRLERRGLVDDGRFAATRESLAERGHGDARSAGDSSGEASDPRSSTRPSRPRAGARARPAERRGARAGAAGAAARRASARRPSRRPTMIADAPEER